MFCATYMDHIFVFQNILFVIISTRHYVDQLINWEAYVPR